MPRYDYKCQECNAVREYTHAIDVVLPEQICDETECEGEMRKLISPTPAVFKGSGWAGKGN